MEAALRAQVFAPPLPLLSVKSHPLAVAQVLLSVASVHPAAQLPTGSLAAFRVPSPQLVQTPHPQPVQTPRPQPVETPHPQPVEALPQQLHQQELPRPLPW